MIYLILPLVSALVCITVKINLPTIIAFSSCWSFPKRHMKNFRGIHEHKFYSYLKVTKLRFIHKTFNINFEKSNYLEINSLFSLTLFFKVLNIFTIFTNFKNLRLSERRGSRAVRIGKKLYFLLSP